jgi:CDP-4-dehydro-6-deoxyglucose reductase, E1
LSNPPPAGFPLVDSSYDQTEIDRCIETLQSGQLTMGKKVKEFEAAFARAVGSPYAVMVNSGSSANLLALAVATNPLRGRRLKRGDRVGVPAVCWSTSIWPIVQMGLVPVLLDVDPGTLNLSLASLERALAAPGLQALVMVHVLGNSTELGPLLQLVKAHDLLLIEDTCESLGSRFGGAWLGTLGAFGTFSFYFSHHMTTIESGMVIARTREDDDLLRCLRAHGWSRDLSNREELEKQSPHIDPRFLFVNLGYNVRPIELQAAFGLEQIRRLDAMNANRRSNVAQLRAAFAAHPRWKGQLEFPSATAGLDPCWFGFPFLLSNSAGIDRVAFTRALMERGIDTRPIVSGNMALQPALAHFEVDLKQGPFAGAQAVHDRGLFIGAHSRPVEPARLDALVNTVMGAFPGA